MFRFLQTMSALRIFSRGGQIKGLNFENESFPAGSKDKAPVVSGNESRRQKVKIMHK